MRKLIAVILCLLCLPSMIVCADGTFDSVKSPETGYEFRIEDGAGLFSETDRLFIRNAAEPVLEYGNALCVTYKTGSMNNESTARKAARLANARLHGNGVVFLIDMQKRMIYIHSVGAVYKVITKAYGRIITDNVYQYASRRQYGKCASEAFEQISMRLQGYRIAEPLRYIVSGLFALFAGFMLNFIIIAISRRKRKAKRNEGESLQILSATVTCTRKEKVQREGGGFGGGGGGGFSGGGFFGGGFSGGGGGHSF